MKYLTRNHKCYFLLINYTFYITTFYRLFIESELILFLQIIFNEIKILWYHAWNSNTTLKIFLEISLREKLRAKNNWTFFLEISLRKNNAGIYFIFPENGKLPMEMEKRKTVLMERKILSRKLVALNKLRTQTETFHGNFQERF